MGEATTEEVLPPATISGIRPGATYWLGILFFFSGSPALMYQIVWQRALFTIYGVNRPG